MKVPVRVEDEDEDDEEEPSKHPDRPIAKAVIEAVSIAEYRREGKTPCMEGTPVIVFVNHADPNPCLLPSGMNADPLPVAGL